MKTKTKQMRYNKPKNIKKIDKFLHKSGLNSNHLPTDEECEILTTVGDEDIFSLSFQERMFQNKEMGLKILSSNYQRFRNILQHFYLNSDQGGRAADLGCGPGVVSSWIAYLCPKAEVVGFDRSESALKLARDIADKHKLNNINFVNATYAEIGKSDKFCKFDFLMVYWSLGSNLKEVMAAIDALSHKDTYISLWDDWDNIIFVDLKKSALEYGMEVQWPETDGCSIRMTKIA